MNYDLLNCPNINLYDPIWHYITVTWLSFFKSFTDYDATSTNELWSICCVGPANGLRKAPIENWVPITAFRMYIVPGTWFFRTMIRKDNTTIKYILINIFPTISVFYSFLPTLSRANLQFTRKNTIWKQLTAALQNCCMSLSK